VVDRKIEPEGATICAINVIRMPIHGLESTCGEGEIVQGNV
jgi:hypothetical protein